MVRAILAPYASVVGEAHHSLSLALMSLQTKGELQEVLNYNFPPDFKDTPNNYDYSKLSKEEIAVSVDNVGIGGGCSVEH